MKILKALMLFLALWVAASVALVAPASAITSLTKSQVENVCGPDLQTGNGHSGCTKKCYNGTSTCIYDCSQKTGDCNGVAVGLVSGGGTGPTGPRFDTTILVNPSDLVFEGGGHHKMPSAAAGALAVSASAQSLSASY